MRTMSYPGIRPLMGLALATCVVWAAVPDDANGQKTTTNGTAKPQATTQTHEHYPHIHSALHDLRKAREELHEAKHDFGGRREYALKAVDHAIHELEEIVKHSPQNGGSGGSSSPSTTKKK